MKTQRVSVAAGSAVQVADRLRDALRRIERGGGGEVPEDDEPVRSGCTALDRLLPAGGFPRGALVEWFSACEGSGAGVLALIVAREASREGGAVVVMDRSRRFYPPAAAALGIDLEKVVVIRASLVADELWALDQALRCSSVAAVWAPLGRSLDKRWLRRFQLAAETSGTLGLLVRPVAAAGQPSWSEAQLRVEPRLFEPEQPGTAAGARRMRVEVVRVRGGTRGGVVEIELDEVTGCLRETNRHHEPHTLHLAAQLAHPKTDRRSARA